LVVDAVEDALVELAVGTPDVVAIGDDLALVVSGDDGFRVAVVVRFVADDPAVPKALGGEVEGGLIIVIPDPGFVVDGDGRVTAEGVVAVGGST
jgi:hypothetical protein